MLKQIIHSALLAEDEKNQVIYGKLLSFLGLGDPVFKALRLLDLDKASDFQILECFIKNGCERSYESFKVYEAILLELGVDEYRVFPVTQSLKLLHKINYLTEEHFNVVLVLCNLIEFHKSLSALDEAHLLTHKNFDVMKSHQDIHSFSWALHLLNCSHLLTQDNFDLVKQHQHIDGFANTLSRFNSSSYNIFTQENFEYLSRPQYNVLITLKIRNRSIWDILPLHLLTQDTFEQLIMCASLENPEIEIERYINWLLGSGAGLNDPQSTHTASIDNSISTSASKLWVRYRAQLSKTKITEIMTTLKRDISNLPNTFKNKAAKRCIERLMEYPFTDSVSKITLDQLLALSYSVIHDDENRWSSKEDAYNQFIDGLYEIQRGYNLSDEGIDDHQEDNPICTTGTFNKLIEKLSGVHPDVELIFITKQTAGLKLPIVVREELKKYLQELSKPETRESFHSFITLINQLSEDGIEIIWNKIKPRVADRLFDEFKSLYQNDRRNLNFLSLVDAGQYVDLNKFDLSAYQQPMISSTGYRKYCSQLLWNSTFFSLGKKDFLSNQHDDNSESPKKYQENWLMDSEKDRSSIPRPRGS